MTTNKSAKAASAPREKGPPRSNAVLRWSRHLHTWFGVVVGILITVEAMTAVYLIHDKSLSGIGSAQLSTGWLPARYRVDDKAMRITALAAGPQWPGRFIAGTRNGLYQSPDGGRSFQWLDGPTAGLEVEALLLVGEHLWVGTKKTGLLRCSSAADQCERVGGFRDVNGLAVSSSGEVLVAAHKQGAFFLDPATGKKTLVSRRLGDTPGARNEKGDVLVTAVLEVRRGSERTWLVGTKQGLFHGSDAAGYQPENLEAGDVVALASAGDRTIALLRGREGTTILSPLWELPTLDRTWHPALGPERATAANIAGVPLMVAGGGALVLTASGGLHLAELGRLPAATDRTVALGRVLTDIHTGEFFGGHAWIVYDLVAVSLIGFVGTGIYLWLIPLLRRRQKRQAMRGTQAAVPVRARIAESE